MGVTELFSWIVRERYIYLCTHISTFPGLINGKVALLRFTRVQAEAAAKCFITLRDTNFVEPGQAIRPYIHIYIDISILGSK